MNTSLNILCSILQQIWMENIVNALNIQKLQLVLDCTMKHYIIHTKLSLTLYINIVHQPVKFQ